MSEDIIQPNIEKIELFCKKILDIAHSENMPLSDLIHSFTALLVGLSITCEANKANLLTLISNQWELNDPENDHPLRNNSPIINIELNIGKNNG